MTGPRPVAPILTALLERVVDYAGLFPPAKLSMHDAVRAYAESRSGADAWMLGRFVVPTSRLEEFDEAGDGVLPDQASASWALAALAGADVELDARSIARFNDRHRDVRRGAVHVDTVEIKATRADEILAADEFLGGFDMFVEMPVAEDPAALISAVAEVGAKAKIRTGGVTADTFPGARHVLRFISCCLEHGVPFKATAGLHHPLRGEYALTYEAASPRGVMYGFLNVLLTTAFVGNGIPDAAALDLLEERDLRSIRFEDDRITWRAYTVDADAIRHARHSALAFGSCAFREPVDDLRRLALL